MNPNNAFSQVAAAADNHKRAKEYLIREFQLEEGDQALIDTLEGMSELPDMLEKIMFHAEQRKAEAEGLQSMIDNLQARKDAGIKYHRRAKQIIQTAMIDADETSIRSPAFTFSVRKTPEKIDIPTPADVPHEYCKQAIKWVPDKEKIKEAMDKGQLFNWATKAPAGTTLSVRTK